MQSIPLEALETKLKVNVGAVVQLEKDIDKQQWFFLAPVAGGYRCKLTLANNKIINIVAITPESPLGHALVGKELDDEVSIKIADKQLTDFITSVL